ncbi:hypothetical protein [Bradyrhizobium sp. TM239]|uniref:hypothetical protein n=1 Tax=Bradyrhizobium sp. TM239 TaxID=2599802 RepID=UPI0027D5A8A5|nr:hypothetical protein TM239_29070 [Bradyrhizobium sp. TM239]
MLPEIAKWGGPIIAAVAAWFSLEFVGKPFLKFYELRASALRLMLRNILTTTFYIAVSQSRKSAIENSREEARKFKMEMNELAVSLAIFKETQWLASRALRLIGYNLEIAVGCAFALSLARLPEGVSPVGGEDDKFHVLEAILRQSLHLSVHPEMAERLEQDFEKWLQTEQSQE